MMQFPYKYICITGMMVFLSAAGFAQMDNTVYFMHGVPQSNRINPAYQPRCGFYLGFPLAAPVRFEFSSSSLAYESIISPHPSEDSLITFLHPLGDREAFLDGLKPLNFVVSDFGTSLGSVGFRTEIGFFSVDITSRGSGSLYIPGDLVRIAIEGTEDGRTYRLDGIGTDLTAFDEISVGWSYNLMDGLQIGARAKMLFGIADLSRDKSELSITTNRDAWRIKSDMSFRASLPFAEVVYDTEGMIDDLIMDDDLEGGDPLTIPRYMFNFNNLGAGVDLGINYRIMDQLQLSASVLDLGFTRWSDEVHEVTYSMDYEYIGLEYNPFDFSEDYTFSDYLDSTFSQMGDSLSGFLQFSSGGTYINRLNTKVFIGASYYFTPNINFGLLSRTDFRRGRILPQVTASANYTTGRFLNVSLTYSYLNDYFKNIGAGLSFNVGPLNLYLISDNALNLVFWPNEARSANLWFGMNLVFGYKQFKKAEFRDRPLVY